VEIQGRDAMLAKCALECSAAIERFGCVISHVFNCSPSIGLRFGAIGVQPSGGAAVDEAPRSEV
jgi:hypothetical protein